MAFIGTKMYGMTPEEWKICDKLFQFGGIAKLQMRDDYISSEYSAEVVRRNKRKIHQLEKEVKNLRHKLKSHLHGDLNSMRQLLNSKRSVKLAYSKNLPHEVIELLKQDLFVRRKKLDKLAFQKRKLMDELEYLLLTKENMKPDEKYMARIQKQESARKAVEKKTEIMKLKFEASKAVNIIYGTMLDVMRKDYIYFRNVIESLRLDAKYQVDCIYKLAVMGQLAMEDFGNIKHPCDNLEQKILRDMIEREKVLKELEGQINHLMITSRRLASCGSSEMFLEKSENFPNKEELETIESFIKQLETHIRVNDCMEIFPMIQWQVAQRIYLLRLLDEVHSDCHKLGAERDELLDHVRKVKMTFYNAKEEEELLESIRKENARLQTTRQSISARNRTLADITYGIQTIRDRLIYNLQFQMSSGEEADESPKKNSLIGMDLPVVDVLVLLADVRKKVALMITNVHQDVSPSTTKLATYTHDKGLVDKFAAAEYTEEEKIQLSLLEDFELADTKVLSRFVIKKKNKEMAEELSKPPIVFNIKPLSKFKSRLGRAKFWL